MNNQEIEKNNSSSSNKLIAKELLYPYLENLDNPNKPVSGNKESFCKSLYGMYLEFLDNIKEEVYRVIYWEFLQYINEPVHRMSENDFIQEIEPFVSRLTFAEDKYKDLNFLDFYIVKLQEEYPHWEIESFDYYNPNTYNELDEDNGYPYFANLKTDEGIEKAKIQLTNVFNEEFVNNKNWNVLPLKLINAIIEQFIYEFEELQSKIDVPRFKNKTTEAQREDRKTLDPYHLKERDLKIVKNFRELLQNITSSNATDNRTIRPNERVEQDLNKVKDFENLLKDYLNPPIWILSAGINFDDRKTIVLEVISKIKEDLNTIKTMGKTSLPRYANKGFYYKIGKSTISNTKEIEGLEDVFDVLRLVEHDLKTMKTTILSKYISHGLYYPKSYNNVSFDEDSHLCTKNKEVQERIGRIQNYYKNVCREDLKMETPPFLDLSNTLQKIFQRFDL